eukprot:CAMPEP_0181180698 /NCGR_PEP_ID=MMETSP1096-20121128/6941_1 /TAXON_ID=156174 ORGANISM="Chrysochromulina ericina, Strain CCMP281" /NCGR_SAMPLE_ID=MMETSP1096 /ASSEMBLY_ACC=CAM_ASM_000453 /LENGTH=125 /DNA_ID=CAMNT_0023269149 /DNA_START=362 /DNA_END=735 /DNA_ORIENTATION=+
MSADAPRMQSGCAVSRVRICLQRLDYTLATVSVNVEYLDGHAREVDQEHRDWISAGTCGQPLCPSRAAHTPPRIPRIPGKVLTGLRTLWWVRTGSRPLRLGLRRWAKCRPGIRHIRAANVTVVTA